MESINVYVQQEGAAKYDEALKLSNQDAKADPETEPYKSKYKAREILLDIQHHLKQYASEHESVYWTAALDCRLGSNFIDTEELQDGQEYLEKCISALLAREMDEKACNILQTAYNQMGILWCTRRNAEKAFHYLNKADELYQKYKHDVGTSPWSIDDLFKPSAENDLAGTMRKRSDHFESTFTHTLYYLAQVYTQMDNPEKSAEYCHKTLRRQLEAMTYECVDWALNCATLSQFYVSRKKYNLARHCLASAETILKETGEPVLKCELSESDGQADVDAKEKLPRSWADIYRCWIKFGLSLLEDSMEDLIEKETRDEDHNSDVSNQSNSEENIEDSEKNTLYFNLETTSVEETITNKFVKNFDEARPIFLSVQRWINKAKEFYELDGHCSDHVELVQDHSKAYKLLAFYEVDFDRQCKMHKRRIDMLEAILGELNTQHYMLVCRQLMFELAETYSAMMDLKLAIIEENESSPTVHQAKKLNSLVSQSIAKFERYVDTLRKPDKSLPPKYEANDERPAIVAHFCLGRLYSKYLEPDPTKRVQNMGRSLEYYTYIREYSERNPDVKSHSRSECEICEEMSVLLPVKIEKVKAQMN